MGAEVAAGTSAEDPKATHYLSSLAVEDLREYDALLVAVVFLVLGMLLAVRCSKGLQRLRESRVQTRTGDAHKTTTSSDGGGSARKRKAGKKTARDIGSDEDIDNLAAEEQAFLEEV